MTKRANRSRDATGREHLHTKVSYAATEGCGGRRTFQGGVCCDAEEAIDEKGRENRSAPLDACLSSAFFAEAIVQALRQCQAMVFADD